jgi:AraC-like DNA-binding protein
VTPDACTDLIALGDGRVLFVGPMLTGGLTTLWQPVTHGVRFHPGTRLCLDGEPELHTLRDADAILDARLPPGAGGAALVAFARRLRDDGRLSRDATVDAVLSAMERAVPAGPDLAGLYRSLGVGERSVQRLFRRYVGLTPKQAARVLRQTALTLALRNEDDGLAGLARAHGYADQAHMSREYRELAGLSPGRYRVEAADVGFVQDRRPLTRTMEDGPDT